MERDDSKQPVNVNVLKPSDFGRLTARGKLRRIGKVLLFLVSFGFAYPNILLD